MADGFKELKKKVFDARYLMQILSFPVQVW